MSLRYDENDPEYLESDLIQTIAVLEEKLKFCILTLREIRFWSCSLEDAQNRAKYVLDRIDKDIS